MSLLKPQRMLTIFASVALALVSASASSCSWDGKWFSNGGGEVETKTLLVESSGSNGQVNVTFDIRHSWGVLPGEQDGSTLKIFVNSTYTVEGSLEQNCSSIFWHDTTFGSIWCRAWSPGCLNNPPDYGDVLGFWAPIQSNMVLQREPEQAAVYGMFQGNVTAEPAISVTIVGEGKNITVPAAINTVQQPQYMEGYNPVWSWPGPFGTWKALLPPMPAGGNYTIFVSCPSCTLLDESFRTANITNVTFGDMIYCSGQSNMWLPVGHNFERNNTQSSIIAGKYNNIRIMAGNSGEQGEPTFNPWMTALEAATTPSADQNCLLFQFGGTCWYAAQVLTDLWEQNGDPIVPIGLADTAIGGQRIEEYMNNATINQCTNRSGEDLPKWDGPLWFKMVVPFVDMTVKGYLWYQGENNMGEVKGNSLAKVGYSCEQQVLVEGWRDIWTKTPNTTSEDAFFGIVSLASSGGEGDPWMGAMHLAQTAGWGVLPSPAMPNSFIVQAYDLDDPYGPAAGPCLNEWACCGKKINSTACQIGTGGDTDKCLMACNAYYGTATVMGGIHPRDKYPVGQRLANAIYNLKYGGTKAYTGPTISGCSVNSNNQLEVRFNTTLLRGDTVLLQPYNASLNMSYFEAITPDLFCVETAKVNSSCRDNCEYYCPSWAGGSSVTNNSALNGSPDTGWQSLNISLSPSKTSILVDLSTFEGKELGGIRYAFGASECCNKEDPNLYVEYSCGGPDGNTGGTYGPCPIMSSSKIFPANPFIAKIVDGKCECIAPQVCDG